MEPSSSTSMRDTTAPLVAVLGNSRQSEALWKLRFQRASAALFDARLSLASARLISARCTDSVVARDDVLLASDPNNQGPT